MSLHEPGRCVHFTGILDDHCKVGVVYDQFRRKGFTLPCINAESRAACERYEEPTEEQIADSKRVLRELKMRDMKLLPAIVALKVQHDKRSWSGKIDCPICGGTIDAAIVAYNGHTRGKCRTEGCVSWVE